MLLDTLSKKLSFGASLLNLYLKSYARLPLIAVPMLNRTPQIGLLSKIKDAFLWNFILS